MARGQNSGSFGGKKPPINNKNSSMFNKKTIPAIGIAASFLVGTVVSIIGWAFADDASWGFLVVNVAFVYAIIHYLILGIIAFFRKLTGKQPEKKASSPAQIKLDNLHNDDGWG